MLKDSWLAYDDSYSYPDVWTAVAAYCEDYDGYAGLVGLAFLDPATIESSAAWGCVHVTDSW